MSALQDNLREWLDDGAWPREHGTRRESTEPRHAALRGVWRLPGRYVAIAVGSALLLVAAVTGVSADPMRGQPLAGVATALSSALGLCVIILAALPRTPRAFAGIGERYARWLLAQVAGLLALIPLFFTGRAFASYFAFAPWLALYAVNALERRRTALRAAEFTGDQPHLAGAAPAGGRGG